MSKPLMEAQGLKELAQYLTELPGRLSALQRHVTSEVASAFLDTMQSKAPSDKDLGNYAKEMKLAQVSDSKYPAYACVYEGALIKVRDLDPEKTLLYVRPVGGAKGSIYSVIAAFQPFDIGLFPLTIPINQLFLISRNASSAEIAATRQRNLKDRPKLDRAIAKSKVRSAAVDRIDLKEARVLPDAAFMVLRKELGLGVARLPHWRPAIKTVAAGAIFKGIIASKTVSRLMTGRYRGFNKLGMLSLKVTDDDMQATKEFQEKILGES